MDSLVSVRIGRNGYCMLTVGFAGMIVMEYYQINILGLKSLCISPGFSNLTHLVYMHHRYQDLSYGT